MRIAKVISILTAAVIIACASAPTGGPLGEGTIAAPKLVHVDTTHPPKSALIELPDSANVALLLVAPGHSATLLYPADSTTNNMLSAGTHQLTFKVPQVFAASDSERIRQLRQRLDSLGRGGSRQRGRTSSADPTAASALPATTPTFLLLVTSPRPLNYRRILEKTAGVSIPIAEMEALNAIAKAVRSTITVEPRDWAAAYQKIEIRRL